MEHDSTYSKETLDILGKIPNRFVRYGLSVFFCTLIGILLGLCSIHYPDTFKTSVTILKKNNSVSEAKGNYIALMQIDATNIWKIENGKSVNIRLNQYPSNIYGLLSGKIIQITPKANEQVYNVYIQLPNELMTNFNKKLDYLSDMSGIAIVKGEDKSLFKRIFSSVLSEK
jgi:hypothetical protein